MSKLIVYKEHAEWSLSLEVQLRVLHIPQPGSCTMAGGYYSIYVVYNNRSQVVPLIFTLTIVQALLIIIIIIIILGADIIIPSNNSISVMQYMTMGIGQLYLKLI